MKYVLKIGMVWVIGLMAMKFARSNCYINVSFQYGGNDGDKK